VEYDLYPLRVQGFDLVENDDDPTIVGGIRDVKRYDVEKHVPALGWAFNFKRNRAKVGCFCRVEYRVGKRNKEEPCSTDG
jgi:hypothetical protein